MPIFSFRRKPSFSKMSRTLPSSADPLAFLQAGRSAGSGEGKDAYNQILGFFPRCSDWTWSALFKPSLRSCVTRETSTIA